MITSTILRMGKLSPKTFLSLGHTALGRTAGMLPEVCESNPTCSFLLLYLASFPKEAMLKGTWTNGV